MDTATIRRAALAALVAGVLPALGACALSWTLRSDIGDAGPASGDAAPEAAADAGSADAEPTADASADVNPPTDADTDAGAPACADLRAALLDARQKARACTLASGQCAAKVTDECACEVFVAVLDSGVTDALKSAIAAAKQANCAENCPVPCPFLPLTGTCLQQGAEIRCVP